MTRREWLRSGAAGLAASRLQAAERPNVLLIMTDQQTISALSAAGNRWVRTPHLDALAARATRFDNSWCCSPVCSPSRSSIVTGCWPSRSGVVYNGDSLNASVPTMGEAFAAAGYDTVWAGKWHLPRPFPGAHEPGATPKQASDRGFRFLPFPVSRDRLQAWGDFTDDPIAESAAEYLRGEHAKPFLLCVSLHNPHDICYWIMDKLPEGHPSLQDAPGELPPLPANHAPEAGEPEFIAACRARKYYGEENTYTRAWDETHWRLYLYAYYRMTERVDRAVGTVLDALKARGLDRETIVVFTSDHGEGMGAHRWVVKLMLWQEVLSVPLMVSWPGRIGAGKRNASLACGADLLPTLSDLARVTAPAGVQGRSLAPALLKSRTLPRKFLMAQLNPDTKDHAMQAHALRTERYKYWRFSSGDRRELLFDLEADPGERRDLARESSMQQTLARHRYLLTTPGN